MHPVLFTNTNHDVTDLVNHGMVKNTKTWISWNGNKKFLTYASDDSFWEVIVF